MILGLAGWSGSGKTSLIKGIIPHLNAMNISVSTLKHAHKDFEIDKPGKDSYIHRESGAEATLISSSKKFALIQNYKNDKELSLKDLLKMLMPVDLIIVEGWKNEKIKKLEVFRQELNKPLLAKKDNNIIAIATNNKNINISNRDILDLNNHKEIATYIKNLIIKDT